MDFHLQLLWELLNHLNPSGTSALDLKRSSSALANQFFSDCVRTPRVDTKLPESHLAISSAISAVLHDVDASGLYRQVPSSWVLRKEGVRFLEQHREFMRKGSVEARAAVHTILNSPTVEQSHGITVLAVPATAWQATLVLPTPTETYAVPACKQLTNPEHHVLKERDVLVRFLKNRGIRDNVTFAHNLMPPWMLQMLPEVTLSCTRISEGGPNWSLNRVISGSDATFEAAAKLEATLEAYTQGVQAFDLPTFLKLGTQGIHALAADFRAHDSSGGDFGLAAVKRESTGAKAEGDLYYVGWPTDALDTLYASYV